MKWLAYIVQNPGRKTEVCLVLRGAQGIGKNRFTDTIAELLAGYSERNITDIEELTGQFNSVIEGKMLLVCNEMRNFGASRLANHDSLKSIITDSSIRIAEKYIPRRTAENVCNMIICSNNDFPVKIEAGDRHYIILDVDAKYKGKADYWTQFEASKTPEFYGQLMRYLMNIDLSQYNPRVIPTTRAKSDIIEASTGKFGRWINLHYTELTTTGMTATEIMNSRPTDPKHVIEEASFKLQYQSKLKYTIRRYDDHGVTRQRRVYVLKDEYRDSHHQITPDGIDADEAEPMFDPGEPY